MKPLLQLLQLDVRHLRVQVAIRRALALRSRHLLLLHYVLLQYLNRWHVFVPDFLQPLVEHNRNLFGCELRHDLAVRSVAIEHTEEPVERLRLLREGLDHLERVLVNLRRQHLLILLLLVLRAAISRRCEHLLENHAASTDSAVLEQLIRLSNAGNAQWCSSAWAHGDSRATLVLIHILNLLHGLG